MPIRFQHQPSGFAVGMAAAAVAHNKGRERRRKYALDLYQNEQRLQARRGQQGLGAEEVGGKWVDPLEEAKTPEEQRMIRARQRRNIQRARQGKAPKYSGASPYWQPGETKADRALREKMDAEKRAEERKIAGEERKRAEVIKDRTAEERRDRDEALVMGLGKIPEWATNDQRRILSNLASGLSLMLDSKDYNLDEPETRQGFEAGVAQYKRLWGQLQGMKPSEAEQEKRGLIYLDAAGELYDENAPGRTAYRPGETEPAFQAPSPLEQEADAVKNQMDFQKKWNELHPGEDEGPASEETREEGKRLSEKLYPSFQSAREALERKAAEERGFRAYGKALPPDAPFGAQWSEDQSALVLPDGTLVPQGVTPAGPKRRRFNPDTGEFE